MVDHAESDDRREGRIARSWRLSGIAWRLVRSDRTILILAVLSSVFGAAGVALIYGLSGMFSVHHHATDGRLALVTLILAYPLTFVSVFFNTAIAAAASALLDGRRLSLHAALSVPARRIGQIALWSLFVTVVGVLIEQIASRLPFFGSLATRLVGLTWSLASMFAIPILATDGCSAPSCLKRSAGLVKKRWGEGISGNVIITAWTALAFVPTVVVIAVAFAATRGQPGARAVTLALVVIAVVLVAAAGAVVRQTFGVVLYRYATTGSAVGGFAASDLQAPFSRGLLGKSTDATHASRRPSAGSLRAWLVCSVIGGALTLAFELNRHHFSAHRISVRVLAAVFVWLALTMALRLLAGAVLWLRRR